MLRSFFLRRFSHVGASLLILALLIPPLPVFAQTVNSATAPAQAAQPSTSEPASDNASATEFDIGPLAREIFESVESGEASNASTESETPPPDEAMPEEEQPKEDGEEEPPPMAMMGSSGDPAGTGEQNHGSNT